jgi:hypothetical protein
MEYGRWTDIITIGSCFRIAVRSSSAEEQQRSHLIGWKRVHYSLYGPLTRKSIPWPFVHLDDKGINLFQEPVPQNGATKNKSTTSNQLFDTTTNQSAVRNFSWTTLPIPDCLLASVRIESDLMNPTPKVACQNSARRKNKRGARNRERAIKSKKPRRPRVV